MTASHRRRTAASASLVVALLAFVSACGSSSSTPIASSSTPIASSSTPISSSTVQCDASAACQTPTVSLGATTLTVASEASKASQTVFAQLVTDQRLHCPGFVPAGGALAIFSSTAPDAPKTVTYTINGTVGQAVAAAHAAHPRYLGCFGSPQPFTGYTADHGSRAVFVSGDGLYEAGLVPCSTTSPANLLPCFSYAADGDTITVTIQAAAGDPKIIL